MNSITTFQQGFIFKNHHLVFEKTITLLLCLFLYFAPLITQGQPYDLLLKNGHVIDPKNKIDSILDIAIFKGKIIKVGKDIPASEATKIVDVTGLLVTPGLIDIHTHVFVGSKAEKFADGINSLSPDDFSFKSGVTTVVDAGTSGWRNFPKFKEQVIDQSQTRVLAFLNIAANGLSGKPEQEDINNMNVDSAVQVKQKYPGIIVGIKIGHYEGKEWTPFDRALDAASKTNTPLFVECHLPQYSLKDQLQKMRPGDIITHSFEQVTERMPLVDDSGKLRPFVLDALKRGVLFDVGHGGVGFWFSQALPAFQQGLSPNTFGTDLHRFSMNAGMKSMINLMSKYLNMGMNLNDVISRATWNAAKAIKHEELGNLSEGSVADVTVINLLNGNFGFVDAGGNRLKGNQKLDAELTIRAGKIVWDLNGLSAKSFK